MDQKPEVKVEPEDKKTGKTRSQPRFKIALGLAVALLLVTCAVAAGGLMTYFRGKCQHKRFTIKASVGGQTFTEEVEVDRENGMVVYRDDISTEEGEIIETKEGLSVLYRKGNCYILKDRENNQTNNFDFDAVEETMEYLSNTNDVPGFDVGQVIFLNRSVPVSPEDDVILRPQLPPVCRDAILYRVQEEDAQNGWGLEMDVEDSRVRRRAGRRFGPFLPEFDVDDVCIMIGFSFLYVAPCPGPGYCPYRECHPGFESFGCKCMNRGNGCKCYTARIWCR